MNNLLIPLYLLLLAIFKVSCQQENYYKQEWLEANPSSFCTHSRSLISYFTSSPNKYEIDLNRSYSAVILNMKWNATLAKKIKHECKFTITTKHFHKSGGIYINILKMKLRQHRNTERCIDSLQIKYNGNIKQAVCGNLPIGKIKSYEDKTGKVKISLTIDTGVPFDRNDDFIEFQIVATAFKQCSDDLENEFDCQPNNIRSCISKQFVNDSFVNCVEPYCLDESNLGCASSSVYFTNSFDDGSSNENIVQIFLSAITSLILTMLTCGAVIWIIYKIKKCVSPQPQTTTTTVNRSRRRRRNNTENVSTSQQDNSPSAPPLDKDDLPPSYSDLFPAEDAATAARKNTTESENNT